MVHVDSLADDYYRFDRATHTLAGHRAGNRYRLGDLLRVAVARVDLDRRELDFPAGRAEGTAGRQGANCCGQKANPPRQETAAAKEGDAAATRSAIVA